MALLHHTMGLILLEALLALVILLGVVWWTMFSGRKGGEPPREDPPQLKPPADEPPREDPPHNQKPG